MKPKVEVMVDTPVSIDRTPAEPDNPRHAVWIDDEQGLRKITAKNPGEAQINVGGVIYEHTRELTPDGPWVYTKRLVSE